MGEIGQRVSCVSVVSVLGVWDQRARFWGVRGFKVDICVVYMGLRGYQYGVLGLFFRDEDGDW